MADPLPEEATALFGVTPEDFIAARDELVRWLREEGRAKDAAAVKVLRKPTLVTWTLNQLAEDDPEGVTALLEAGAEVRAAQQVALSSSKGAPDRLNEASAVRRTAVVGLGDRARLVLEGAGRASAQHLDAVRRALEAASTDPAAGEHLRTGTFERPPEPVAGFGDLAGLTLVPEPAEPSAGAASGPTTKRSRAAARDEPGDRMQGTERKRLRRDRDAAVREARKTREAADRYARELEAMRRRLAVVEAKHRAADKAASAQEKEAKRAESALARASKGGSGHA